MGRKNKIYSKTLHQQAYEKLTSMQAFGESKRDAVNADTEKDKIFSYATYQTYWKHIKYYLSWLKAEHPDCTTLKSARRYVNEWLQSRVDQKLSAWTIQTEAAAISKLFQIDKSDPKRFQPPKRLRENIKRSRISVARDKHFSKTNNDELIRFCRGTGCRRNVLERLEGRDYWTRDQMSEKAMLLQSKLHLSGKEEKHLRALQEALKAFPNQQEFLHHRKDKNGRYRFAPIVGPDKEQIIGRMKRTGLHEKVWLHVNSRADIHSYRADYASRVYKEHARKISTIPYDRFNRGTGHRYQSDVYVCRKDESGKRLDRKAMYTCSIALGHNRVSVVADNYLRGL